MLCVILNSLWIAFFFFFWNIGLFNMFCNYSVFLYTATCWQSIEFMKDFPVSTLFTKLVSNPSESEKTNNLLCLCKQGNKEHKRKCPWNVQWFINKKSKNKASGTMRQAKSQNHESSPTQSNKSKGAGRIHRREENGCDTGDELNARHGTTTKLH